MEIRNYITFLAVVEENGFTKAAKRLNYGQSTVTLHISELEKHYDALLFERMGKRIFLTPFGQHLYEHAKAFVSAYEALLDLGGRKRPNPILRVGVYESLLHYRIQGLIQTFKRDMPHVDLIIRHGTCNELREQLRLGQLDLAFQIEPKTEFADLLSEVLVEERFCLIFPKGQMTSAFENKAMTVYFTERECTYRKVFEHYLDVNGIIRHQVMETGSVEVIKQYVACGLGYSFVPEVTVREPELLQRLDSLPLNLEAPMFTQILRHKDKQLSPEMNRFLELLRAEASQWQ